MLTYIEFLRDYYGGKSSTKAARAYRIYVSKEGLIEAGKTVQEAYKLANAIEKNREAALARRVLIKRDISPTKVLSGWEDWRLIREVDRIVAQRKPGKYATGFNPVAAARDTGEMDIEALTAENRDIGLTDSTGDIRFGAPIPGTMTPFIDSGGPLNVMDLAATPHNVDPRTGRTILTDSYVDWVQAMARGRPQIGGGPQLTAATTMIPSNRITMSDSLSGSKRDIHGLYDDDILDLIVSSTQQS